MNIEKYEELIGEVAGYSTDLAREVTDAFAELINEWIYTEPRYNIDGTKIKEASREKYGSVARAVRAMNADLRTYMRCLANGAMSGLYVRKTELVLGISKDEFVKGIWKPKKWTNQEDS